MCKISWRKMRMNFDALFQSGSLSLAKGEAEKAVRDFEHLSSAYRPEPAGPIPARSGSYLLYANSSDSSAVKPPQGRVDAAESSLKRSRTVSDPQFRAGGRCCWPSSRLRKGNPAAAVDLLAPLTKERPQHRAGALPARHRLFAPTEEG